MLHPPLLLACIQYIQSPMEPTLMAPTSPLISSVKDVFWPMAPHLLQATQMVIWDSHWVVRFNHNQILDSIILTPWYIGTPPSTPSDPKSGLQYHDNFGQFGIDLAGAQSTSYDEWANKATANSTRIGSFTSTSARFSGSARRGASGRRSAAVTSTNNLTSTSGTSNPKKLYKFRGVSGLRYEWDALCDITLREQ